MPHLTLDSVESMLFNTEVELLFSTRLQQQMTASSPRKTLLAMVSHQVDMRHMLCLYLLCFGENDESHTVTYSTHSKLLLLC